ncbi:DNA-binding response regulator [Paenibacillus paeoniae]|uniref:DNA-binding response regulator n=2 Tax=Paenibacillus paeoniae TaxID=2292705 RepID=A0A371PED9_9BACL|nr:DNA-binding response regulator [Paenibacillus paeoniae]
MQRSSSPAESAICRYFGRASSEEVASPHMELTEREKEVLLLMAEGASNKEIAVKLTVTSETVKTHVRNIFKKLNVDRRIRAVAVAEKLKLLQS